MKTFALAVFAAAILPVVANAATPQPAAPATQAVPASPATCPTIPDDSAMSPATQRLFTTITDACLLKMSGLIADDQFAAIRDQAVGDLLVQMQMDSSQMQADANAKLAKSLAAN